MDRSGSDAGGASDRAGVLQRDVLYLLALSPAALHSLYFHMFIDHILSESGTVVPTCDLRTKQYQHHLRTY